MAASAAAHTVPMTKNLPVCDMSAPFGCNPAVASGCKRRRNRFGVKSRAIIRLPGQGCCGAGTSNMQDLAELPAFVAWCAFGLAVVFGAVANRVNFCTMGAVSDLV